VSTDNNNDLTNQEVTAREAGRRGGRSTLATHGVEHYRRIGCIGGQRTRQLYGEILKQLGQRGGRPRRPD